MNRKPQVGDLLKYGIRNATQVVVAVNEEVSEDRLRGDAYYATTFDTINYRQTTQTSPNPKVNKFYLTGASMNLPDRILIDLSHLEVVGYSEVGKSVEVVYSFGPVKDSRI